MFESKYPYTDFHELNLDWVLSKITEFETEITGIEEGILKQANKYTDTQITERLANVEAQYTAFKAEVNASIAELDSSFDSFKQTVFARMAVTDARLAQFNDRMDTMLQEANAYTQQAIANNNDYIVDQTTKALGGVKVLNYFTGARVSIQEMFDYLAHFHLENAITVTQLVSREKTVDTLVALNMTMTDLATNGGTIITA